MTNRQGGMKRSIIKSVLRRKVDAWIDSLPEPLRERARKETIVTGGCIASMLLGEEVNDYDIYFRTPDFAEAVAHHYVERFKRETSKRIDTIEVLRQKDIRDEPRVMVYVKSAGVESASRQGEYQYFETAEHDEEAGEYVAQVITDPGEIQEAVDAEEARAQTIPSDQRDPFRPVFLSTNAISLTGGIQLILRFYGEPEQIHANYDFAHCTCYYDRSSAALVLPPKALEALLSRQLVYQGSRYPVCSLFRVRKFIERGWTVNAGQIVKMALQISELDLHRLDVLEDQLTGVDAAYFHELLDVVRRDKGDAQAIDQTYLVEIIDLIFT